MEKKMSPLAQAVQEAQRPRPTIDLVYNSDTGVFSETAAGSVKEGLPVTEITKGGFACRN